MNKPIRYMIADDEALARESIQILLSTEEDMIFKGFCKDGGELLEALNNEKIDLLWLDVQMPILTGFEVLEKISMDRLPYIIFVTAYDEYALKAFEFNTIDYLLKPYSNDRFYKALKKAKEVLGKNEMDNSNVIRLLSYFNKEERYRKRISVSLKDKIILLDVKDIEWIRSAKGYLEIFVGGKNYLISESLKKLEQQLNPEDFVRIHRSTIVNIQSIQSLEPWFNGEYNITLKGGEKFKLSRNYKDKLKVILDSQ